MAIETCARCGNQTAKLDKCDYCNRVICNTCIKSQKRKKIGHRIICKSCWSNMTKRSMYKSTN
jgi:methionyl-tRNA synthetase